MHDVLQPIIHKAPVLGLAVNVNRTGLCIGDPADVRLMEDGQVGIFATVRKRRMWLFPRQVQAYLGHLGPNAGRIITPALVHGDHLRVRIVGLTPEHLSHAEGAEVHVSVWGDLKRVAPPKSAAAPAPEADPEMD